MSIGVRKRVMKMACERYISSEMPPKRDKRGFENFTLICKMRRVMQKSSAFAL